MVMTPSDDLLQKFQEAHAQATRTADEIHRISADLQKLLGPLPANPVSAEFTTDRAGYPVGLSVSRSGAVTAPQIVQTLNEAVVRLREQRVRNPMSADELRELVERFGPDVSSSAATVVEDSLGQIRVTAFAGTVISVLPQERWVGVASDEVIAREVLPLVQQAITQSEIFVGTRTRNSNGRN